MHHTIANAIEQGCKPILIHLGKVAQHKACYGILMTGMTDAHADAVIVRADMLVNRPQPVVSSMATTGFDTDLGGGKIKLVVEHNHIRSVDLMKPSSLANSLTRQVHECLRLKQYHLIRPNAALGYLALKLGAPRGKPMRRRNFIHSHKADVMTIAGVFSARISKTNN